MSNAKTATEKYVDDAIAAVAGGGGTDTVAWDNVTDKPTFSTVATSGSYNDLLNKPTIPAPVDISGKADKSEMLVTPGTGADADKTTIQLKSGTSATVLTAHQDISGKADAAALPYALVMVVTGNLADRAVNAVPVSTNTTLTLPAANQGHSRDLLVRLTVSATSAVTWAVAQGESWDAMGAPPSSFAAGTHLYRFTEVAAGVWHCEDMLALVGLEAALAGKIPQYSIVAVTPSSGTLTVAPYTVATYTAGSSAEAFTVAVGAGTTGKARDCILVIDGTATDAVAPTVTWPSNFHPRTDAGTDFACEATRNVYYISEYATGEFAVGGWQETSGGNA